MPKSSPLEPAFAALRGMLAAQSKRLLVIADRPGNYQVGSPTMKDRIGRPLFVAAVQTKKNYVSYHLLPLYMNPALLKSVPPALRKRMQGKACFNFTTVDRDQVKELAAVTKAGIADLKKVKLPWAKD